MKLYTILILMLFLGYPYPAVSGQVSAAEHEAILSEIEKVEQIRNFKGRSGILKTSLKKHKNEKKYYSVIRNQTQDVLNDIAYLRSKKIACHDGKCNNLENRLKSLKQTITSHLDPVKTQTTDPVKTQTTDPVKTQTTDPAKTQTTDPTKTQTTDPAKTQTTDPTKTQTTDPTKTQTTDPTKTQTTDPTKTQTAEPAKIQTTEPAKTQTAEPAKTQTAEPTNNKGRGNNKKIAKKLPPPAPILPKKEATFYEKLKSTLHEGKNDSIVEKILTAYIIDNDTSAQERIFYPLQENEKTKHFFNAETPPSGGTDTGNSWLALLGMLLFGIAAGAGGMYAFARWKQQQLSPDQIEAEINKHFKNNKLENASKQKIILNQMDSLDTKSATDTTFYQELGKKTIGKLDEEKKQEFLIEQVKSSPNQHLPIAQSIVNQLDKKGKETLGIGKVSSHGSSLPSTPGDKAKQISEWLNESNVRKQDSLREFFAPPVATKGTYFLGEVLTAAGPRKTEESELGEDIAGMMMKDDYAIFWIMDGSSDYSKIKDGENKEIYSSRVLAMTLAEQVQIGMRQESRLNGSQVTAYLKKAIENTITELNKRVNQPEIKRLLQQFAANGNNITVATTATLGLLHKNGDLWVCKIGDDKISANGETVHSKYGALVICDVQSEFNVLSIDMAELKEDWLEAYRKKGVQTVIASSDGINDTIYKWIENNKQVSPDQIRRFKEHQNKTFDDKSLCIIQIINN